MDNDLDQHVDRALLQQEIQQALQETLFSSGLNISPRQLGRVAQDVVETFFEYYATGDDAPVRTKGKRLAVDGLGVSSMLAAAESLNGVCRQSSNPLEDLPDVAGLFVTILLEGFIQAREQLLLQEQERTFQALLRARGKTGRSDG